MNIRDKIKSLLALKCITMTKLAEMLTDKSGNKYTLKSLSNKLKRGSISANEFLLILDVLGFEFKIIEK